MSFYDRGAAWYLAQLKPNCSRIAEKNLRRQGFNTFLPLSEVTRKRNGRFVVATQPLFPGYIFVSQGASQGLWHKINSTYGVSRLVSVGRDPAVVPPDVMSQITLRCDDTGMLLPPEVLKPGDQVRLTSGPFANLVAEIEKVEPDRRVWVLLDILGGQTRVAVDADKVQVA